MYSRPVSLRPQQEPQSTSTIITDMQERANLTCFICAHSYNTTNRIPKIVCRRQHTYCAECVVLMHKTLPMRCPECRFKVYKEHITVNRAVLSICQFFPTLKKEINAKEEENQRLKKENQDLLVKIYQLKNQISRAQTETKQKTRTTPQESPEESKQKGKESFTKTTDKKKLTTPVKRSKLQSLGRPLKLPSTRHHTESKLTQLHPQLQINVIRTGKSRARQISLYHLQ